MKTMLTVVMLLSPLLLGTGMAHGNDNNNQRQDCNKQAEGLTGNERNRMISSCIRRNASTKTTLPLLAKMTQCNQKAGDMTGDPRVKFVDKCLQEQ